MLAALWNAVDSVLWCCCKSANKTWMNLVQSLTRWMFRPGNVDVKGNYTNTPWNISGPAPLVQTTHCFCLIRWSLSQIRQRYSHCLLSSMTCVMSPSVHLWSNHSRHILKHFLHYTVVLYYCFVQMAFILCVRSFLCRYCSIWVQQDNREATFPPTEQ